MGKTKLCKYSPDLLSILVAAFSGTKGDDYAICDDNNCEYLYVKNVESVVLF